MVSTTQSKKKMRREAVIFFLIIGSVAFMLWASSARDLLSAYVEKKYADILVTLLLLAIASFFLIQRRAARSEGERTFSLTGYTIAAVAESLYFLVGAIYS